MIEKSAFNPLIYEDTGNREKQYDIFSRLLKDRIIFLDGEINDITADLIVAQLLYLESQDTERDISMYINSPGGSVTAGLAIYDTIQFIKPDVMTICIGQAASMAAVLLTCGTKGKRYSLPSSRILIHQSWGGAQGQARDIGIQAKEIVRLKKMTIKHISHHTGKDKKTVAKDMERDFYMTPEESMKYGLIDEVMVRRNDAEK